MPFGTEKLE